MLNCTDLACVLHHHNFYAHLHQLKQHLQDGDNTVISSRSTAASSDDNNDNTQANSNETDSDLSSLHHIDTPNTVIYMICGVLIAMILVGLIIILVAVTISKLRKREEHSSSTPPTTCIEPTIEAQQANHLNNHHHHHHHHQQQQQQHRSSIRSCNNINNNNNINSNNCNDHQISMNSSICSSNSSSQNSNNSVSGTELEVVTFTRTSGVNSTTTTTGNDWVFPPKAPTPNIYHCMNHITLDTGNELNGGFKGFRKQFSGRFKRLVTKKQPETPTAVIPPELRPQLKTIYVY